MPLQVGNMILKKISKNSFKIQKFDNFFIIILKKSDTLLFREYRF